MLVLPKVIEHSTDFIDIAEEKKVKLRFKKGRRRSFRRCKMRTVVLHTQEEREEEEGWRVHSADMKYAGLRTGFFL